MLPYVDPMFAYVGRGNALPHSSDRNDGGDGVARPGRRLGRHASITFGYHRRPPARTRAAARGPAPGLKGYRPCRRPQQYGGGGQRSSDACFSISSPMVQSPTAGFQPNGWPFGLQRRSRSAEPLQDSGPMGGRLVCRADLVWPPLNPLKAWRVERYWRWATHAKQQSLCRIQAQWVAVWSAAPISFRHLRTR